MAQHCADHGMGLAEQSVDLVNALRGDPAADCGDREAVQADTPREGATAQGIRIRARKRLKCEQYSWSSHWVCRLAPIHRVTPLI